MKLKCVCKKFSSAKTYIITDLGNVSLLSKDMGKAIFGHQVKTRIGVQLVRKAKSRGGSSCTIVLTGVSPQGPQLVQVERESERAEFH